MFRSRTIIRELVLNLVKVIFMLKHSAKLGRYMLFVDVAACVKYFEKNHKDVYINSKLVFSDIN